MVPVVGFRRLTLVCLVLPALWLAGCELWLNAATMTIAGVFATLLFVSLFRSGMLSIGFAAALRANPSLAGTASGFVGAVVSVVGALLGSLAATFYAAGFDVVLSLILAYFLVSFAVAACFMPRDIPTANQI